MHFSLFSRPLRECCSSQWNIDGFGSTFRILEHKVHFLVNFMKKCTFLIFSSKVHFSHFLAKSALFAPKCDFGPKSAIWELGEPPEGSRDRPRGEPRGGGEWGGAPREGEGRGAPRGAPRRWLAGPSASASGAASPSALPSASSAAAAAATQPQLHSQRLRLSQRLGLTLPTRPAPQHALAHDSACSST